jgi:hypothetical protein
MSDNTLEQGAADHGLRRRPLRARLPRDRVNPAHEEGAFDDDVMEVNSPTTRRKKAPRRDEMVRRQLGKDDKNKIPGIYNRAAYCAERMRLIQH